MHLLSNFSSRIDRLNRWIAWIASGCVLAACLVSAGNAAIRYTFNLGSNAWLELQWYLFAYMVMLGAAFVLKANEHVRVDLIYGPLSTRAKIWVDLLGLLIFLMPATLYLLYLCLGPAIDAFHTGEISPNAGGLVRWPARMALPVGFFLVALQGASEIVKRIAMLTGHLPAESHYERPLQ
ncbi:MAG: TRAP transporter small permease subunit [Betaproteobacteria bacterium]|nr:TRAP transporter small permease subunit [Betaproteobacteria bacterium]